MIRRFRGHRFDRLSWQEWSVLVFFPAEMCVTKIRHGDRSIAWVIDLCAER